MTVIWSVTDQPLVTTEIIASLGEQPSAGASVVFEGIVRNHDEDRDVTRLEYEGHPLADKILGEIATEVLAKHPEVIAAAVHHRIGHLEIGDAALVAVAYTAHRGPAFAATSELVEQVKARLPIWKHQFFPDGGDEWVNSP